MKRIYPVICILFLVAYFSSCERDDICVDGDTPLLVLGFFDIEDTTVVKSVSSIRVKAIDNDSILNDNENFRFTDRGNTSTQDSILIPLQISAGTTSFTFISDSADDADSGEETGNIDTLTISYTTREVFISRGCGFVINYDDLDIQLTNDTENWIQDIRIQQRTIENSNSIHVKIFH